MGACAPRRYFCFVNSAAHEKKILEYVQQVSYCTECLEDYLVLLADSFRQHLEIPLLEVLPKALRQIRQEVVAKRDKNTSQQANE